MDHGRKLRDFPLEALRLCCQLLPASPKQSHHVPGDRLTFMILQTGLERLGDLFQTRRRRLLDDGIGPVLFVFGPYTTQDGGGCDRLPADVLSWAGLLSVAPDLALKFRCLPLPESSSWIRVLPLSGGVVLWIRLTRTAS